MYENGNKCAIMYKCIFIHDKLITFAPYKNRKDKRNLKNGYG